MKNEGQKTINEEKEKALDSAIASIEKNYGRGTIMRLDGDHGRMSVEAIPTGILALDIALGVGGIPRGRIIEIYGSEGSGKTTIALTTIASCQKMGGKAVFIDAEHALDPAYAERLGIDLSELIISQPDSAEQALEIAEILTRSGAIDLFVVDSVAALVPKAELEGEMGDASVGLQARLMSKAMRKLAGAMGKSRTAGIFINQLREKIGVMFGNPETTPGGRALKFATTIRMEVKRGETYKDADRAYGAQVKVKVAKNKVAPPYRTANFDIIFGSGISRESQLLSMGVDLDIVDKSGTWFSFDGERLGQGRENAKATIVEKPEIANEIEKRIKEAYGLVSKTDGKKEAKSD
ncbi:MAG TPA: recombinase RecA [Caldisericia bacterium]|nr:recombinase RecA [Caldisericia bacterium]HPF48931.1 recombinase RecA [Caldisericia bacterium]HPI83205.1 recombinase RecA [Caldisericia bacterium]HPQ92432.1 recombinase RecA [Caldisericia bacterium]HRV74470.1 recombinase RecA [Caldisericia bacterium]